MPKQPSARTVPSRSIVLAAGTFTALGTGAIYMWSVFNKPLMAMFGYSASEVALAYSLFEFFTLVGSIIAGWLQNRLPSRSIVLGAGMLFGAGWIGAGFSESLWTLYLFFSVFAGLGNGGLYNTIVAVVTKWFADKRGFASGVCIGAIGLSSFIFAPLGNALIESFDVQAAFRIVGIIWIVVYAAFSWLLVTPPPNWMPGSLAEPADAQMAAGKSDRDETAGAQAVGTSEQANAAGARAPRNLGAGQMLQTPLFYCLLLLFMAGGTTGHMLSGHTSNIAQNLAGLTPAEGALIISVMALGSTAGRFGFGTLSDKAGRYTTLIGIFALNAMVMLVLMPLSTSFAALAASICIAGACFGGIVTIVPAMTGDCFGSANFGQNYAFVFAGQTAASFIGPITAAVAVDSTGTYLPAFAVAGILSLVAIGLTLACRHFDRKLDEHPIANA